jgi:hypothetical protein
MPKKLNLHPKRFKRMPVIGVKIELITERVDVGPHIRLAVAVAPLVRSTWRHVVDMLHQRTSLNAPDVNGAGG